MLNLTKFKTEPYLNKVGFKKDSLQERIFLADSGISPVEVWDNRFQHFNKQVILWGI